MTIKYWAAGTLTGVSGDTKPTNAQTGWTFTETDTDAVYLFTGSAWDQVL